MKLIFCFHLLQRMSKLVVEGQLLLLILIVTNNYNIILKIIANKNAISLN